MVVMVLLVLSLPPTPPQFLLTLRCGWLGAALRYPGSSWPAGLCLPWDEVQPHPASARLLADSPSSRQASTFPGEKADRPCPFRAQSAAAVPQGASLPPPQPPRAPGRFLLLSVAPV